MNRLRQELPFLLVAAVVAFAFVYLGIWPEHWLRGSGIVAAGLILGGVLRWVLPPHRAGLLAIRAKWLDVLCYLTLGVLVIITGLLLPR